MLDSRNYGNHGNDENHGNPGCKPRVPQSTGLEIGRLIFYHYWYWCFGAQYWYKSVLVIVFLENTREFHEIITNTGANFGDISALQYCTGNFSGSEKYPRKDTLPLRASIPMLDILPEGTLRSGLLSGGLLLPVSVLK